MFILSNVWGIIRTVLFTIDQVAYSLIDNAYDLINAFASASFFNDGTVETVMQNTYIIIGLFALFKIALLLVNALINPDKLFDKESGFAIIVRNVVIMFALLIFVPILFKESMKIQNVITEGSYINSLFGLKVSDDYNPGNTFKRQAIKALVKPNEYVATQKNDVFEATDNCPDNSTHCKDAIDDYNEAISGDGDLFALLSEHIKDYVKVDDNKIYVYDYAVFLTFIVGIAITYLLIVFCFDLAERVIKLAILEIVSPLFIVTYIDPKSAKSGPFKNWLKEVGSTYVGLYIRLVALALILILLNLWDKVDPKVISKLGTLGTIIFVLSILIFAKSFPKWLASLIGIKDFDNGIGGLGKRLGSAALVGGALTKAGHAALGMATGSAKSFANQVGHRRALKKDLYEKNGLNKGISKKNRDARKNWLSNNMDDKGKSYSELSKKQQRDALKKARRQALLDSTEYSGNHKNKDKERVARPKLTGLAQLGAATLMGTINGAKLGAKSDNIKSALKSGFTGANQFAEYAGLRKNTGIFGMAGDFIKGLPGAAVSGAYGNSDELYDIRDRQEKREKIKSWTEKGKYGIQDVGVGKGKVAGGQGDVNKICDAVSKGKANMGELNNASFAAAQYAINRGYVVTDDKGNIKNLDNVKYNSTDNTYSFIGSDGKVKETIKSEDMARNCGGIIDSSSAGSVNQEKMVNTYKNQALSNYQQNEQIRSQEISSYQTAKAESDKIQNSIAALGTMLSSLKVSFDAKDATTIKNSVSAGITEIENKIKELEGKEDKDTPENKERKKQYNDTILKLKEYESQAGNGLDAKAAFVSAANANLSNIKAIVDAQNELKPVIDSIKGNTLSEKANTLNIEDKKITTKMEGLKPKSSDDKK